ncbi:hypothetical protein [Pseudonocardia humida]|uniref:Succinate dehydrogenase n=1 Tax=Pseudonocardia humida TaxID=2800819 RepID=A0ABT1A886_9PSEU|nr:hypothetical protein [Pseudonocardia humida]MCO1659171.1 hypothetical protein [Pseudonocardia humida]
MSSTLDPSAGRAELTARTFRKDRWWLTPAVQATALTVLLGYVVVRLFMRSWYFVPELNYLTPLYSPCISTLCTPGSSHFGTIFGELPFWIPLPIIVFPILLGFRGTCYYYRKAVYRSILQSPTACAVAEPAKRYRGESRFPLIGMNSHRYFFYGATLLLLINTYDAVLSFFPQRGGFGIGLGSLIIVVNVLLLWAYTLGCHSCRHLLGGRLRHFSKHPVRYRLWTRLSWFNARHQSFAWASLISVTLTDVYIMSVSAGWIGDLRLVN